MTTAYEMPRVRDQDSSFSPGVAGVIVSRDLVYRMRNRAGAILRALLGLWEGQRFGGIDDRPPDIRAVAANTLNCPKNARKIEPFDPKQGYSESTSSIAGDSFTVRQTAKVKPSGH